MTPLDRCPFEHCGRDLLPGEVCALHGFVGIETPFGYQESVLPPDVVGGVIGGRDRPTLGDVEREYAATTIASVREFEEKYAPFVGEAMRTVPNAEGEPVPIPLTRTDFWVGGAGTWDAATEFEAWTWRDSVRLWWRDVRETLALWLAPWLDLSRPPKDR